jgi:hypothetical protein
MPGRIASIPKADLHLHAEAGPRLQRLLAESKGEPPYDWKLWATRLMRDTATGIARLEKLAKMLISPEEEADPDNFRARIVAVLKSEDTLRDVTISAIHHSFTSTSRRERLLKSIG